MRKEQPINDHVKRKLQNWRKDMREEDLPHLFVPRSTYTTFVRFASTVLERAWISSPPTGRVYQSLR